MTAGEDEGDSLNLREVRHEAESKAIRVALTKSYGNISKAAEMLGITRPTLYDLLSKYGCQREGYSKKALPADSSVLRAGFGSHSRRRLRESGIPRLGASAYPSGS